MSEPPPINPQRDWKKYRTELNSAVTSWTQLNNQLQKLRENCDLNSDKVSKEVKLDILVAMKRDGIPADKLLEHIKANYPQFIEQEVNVAPSQKSGCAGVIVGVSLIGLAFLVIGNLI